MTSGAGEGQAGGAEGRAVHFQYNVDLSNPTEERLEAIKNDLVQKIAQSVSNELQDIQGNQPEMMETHDRHYSIHSRE